MGKMKNTNSGKAASGKGMYMGEAISSKGGNPKSDAITQYNMAPGSRHMSSERVLVKK